MAEYRVDCITRPDRNSPNQRIRRLGGQWPNAWNDSEENVIGFINRREHNFFTLVNGARAEVIVGVRDGRYYLKTTADTYLRDNLFHLPDC
jgi:hypothetical protein